MNSSNEVIKSRNRIILYRCHRHLVNDETQYVTCFDDSQRAKIVPFISNTGIFYSKMDTILFHFTIGNLPISYANLNKAFGSQLFKFLVKKILPFQLSHIDPSNCDATVILRRFALLRLWRCHRCLPLIQIFCFW